MVVCHGTEEIHVDEEVAGDFGALPARMHLATLSDGEHGGLIQVLWFADRGSAAAAAGTAQHFGCDNDDLYHMLKDTHALVLVGVEPDGDAPHPVSAAAMDEMQQRVRAKTGAQVIC